MGEVATLLSVVEMDYLEINLYVTVHLLFVKHVTGKQGSTKRYIFLRDE